MKKNTILPYYYFKKILENTLNEIKINPEYVDYQYLPALSKYFNNEIDRIMLFSHGDILYVLAFLYFPINNIETYNIVFTTYDQWQEYLTIYEKVKRKGFITEEDNELISSIINKPTDRGEVYPLMRKISWIIFDVDKNYLKGSKFSLIDTKDIKIRLYRNIIKDSFKNIKETPISENGYGYFIYEII